MTFKKKLFYYLCNINSRRCSGCKAFFLMIFFYSVGLNILQFYMYIYVFQNWKFLRCKAIWYNESASDSKPQLGVDVLSSLLFPILHLLFTTTKTSISKVISRGFTSQGAAFQVFLLFNFYLKFECAYTCLSPSQLLFVSTVIFSF